MYVLGWASSDEAGGGADWGQAAAGHGRGKTEARSAPGVKMQGAREYNVQFCCIVLVNLLRDNAPKLISKGPWLRCQFTFCVYSNLSISSRAKQRHHTTLVVGVASSPSNCSGFTSVVSLCAARVSSEWARAYRAQIIILRHFIHEPFSFVLCRQQMCLATCDAKRDTVIKCQMIRHNDHYHHPISHTHRLRQVAVKDVTAVSIT